MYLCVWVTVIAAIIFATLDMYTAVFWPLVVGIWLFAMALEVALAYLMRSLFPFNVTPAGVEGHSAFGTIKHLTWDKMRDSKTMYMGGINYVRIRSTSGGLPMWLPLFIEKREDFIGRINDYAPIDNPLREYLSTVKA